MAIDVLRSKGVPEDHILFLNLIASPEGARNFAQQYPKVRVVTAFVDQGLNEKKFVLALNPYIRHYTNIPLGISYLVLEILETDSTQHS
jgi:hypothetical protein